MQHFALQHDVNRKAGWLTAIQHASASAKEFAVLDTRSSAVADSQNDESKVQSAIAAPHTAPAETPAAPEAEPPRAPERKRFYPQH